MTVQSTNNRTDTIADGIQTVFVYDYYLINAAHMTVLFDAVDQPTGWTVSGVGDPGGGNVTFDVAPADGVRVTLLRVVPLTQEIDYTEYDPFPAEVAETALDLEVMRDQQGVEVNSRNLSFSINDLPSGGSELATPQASFAIGYDAFGNLTNLDVGGGEGSGVRNPLVADLFGGGFDIIMQDAPLGTVTITIDGPTGVIDATDVTVPNGSVDTHIGTANIHFADAAADGKQYVRQDSAWTEVDVPPGTIISDTPPVSPVDGQTWFESDTGVEWIWYDDGVGTPSGQWVETGPSPVGLEGGGGGDGNVTAPAGGTTTGFITTYANDAGTFLDTGLPTSTFLTPAQGDAAYDSLGSAAGVQTNLTTHENAADPHPQYLTPAEGDAAYTPLTLINNGEILFYNTGAHQKLGIGTQDQVLTVKSGIPSWETAAGGAAVLGRPTRQATRGLARD
jgi:hypothetical protein